ncbi:mRNA interferase YafQ [Desulfonatronum thiosulfatophilum]|uniref:mRNA interferase YafQ n=1 Tax=Desulfonatronum thiosulfatophilum TaxID=617002 RepID=A0A1G6E1Y9_9BACT|nr:type II toxin-antitoxin system YafQ family toxin [Desulfonatronum thiosulfatophilum]SDB51408.1 mRNA interferase YafQ [Desulfonatronum thiosulfatophilum]
MYTPVYTKQFEKDAKRCVRRGKDMERFKILARTLLSGEPLDPIHREHKLSGTFVGRRDCHIDSDWVLIYRIEGDQLNLRANGTHSDLFKK